MEKGFKKRIIKTSLMFSLGFALLMVLVFIAINTFLPDFLLKKYISRSRELAQVLSQSLEEQKIETPHERMIRRIVQLNFPEESNFVHILIRDQTGTATYSDIDENDEEALAEFLKQQSDRNDELTELGSELVLVQDKTGAAYYTITTPIYQNGERSGEVVVGFSKKYLIDRIELNRNQVAQLVFIGSLSFVFLLIVSFLGNMRLFIKFKHSEERVETFKSLAYVGELSSGLAHEIRNPLNLMSINLQLLREGLKNGDLDKVEKKIEVLEKAKNHAASILDEFLGFSKLRGKKDEVFDFVALLDSIKDLVIEEAQMRGAKLRFETAVKKVLVRADSSLFRQVMLNLVINALDAVEKTKTKDVFLRLNVKKAVVQISVEDSGIGMDEFTRNNIFTPFFSKKTGGTGLGLAVVKKIIDEYQGEITCDSTSGQGASFLISLKGILA